MSEVPLYESHLPRTFFSFFFTLVTGPRRSLSLKLSGTRVYEPQNTYRRAVCSVLVRGGYRRAVGSVVVRGRQAHSPRRGERGSRLLPRILLGSQA